MDFSPPLLREASSPLPAFPARFQQLDITKLSAHSDQLSVAGGWDVITAFAVLHHIPSKEIRLNILSTLHGLLADDGRFILSNWQFLNSEKLKARIKPWADVSIPTSAVDAGDYLLDWRSGGEGLRYVHHFSVAELTQLAHAARFAIRETFYSDGETGNLGLYQIWEPDSTR